MSISFVTELSGRGGTIGEDSERKLVFQSDSALDTEYDVYQNRNCPKIGSRHPNRRFSLFFLKRGDLSITQSDSNWARLKQPILSLNQVSQNQKKNKTLTSRRRMKRINPISILMYRSNSKTTQLR